MFAQRLQASFDNVMSKLPEPSGTLNTRRLTDDNTEVYQALDDLLAVATEANTTPDDRNAIKDVFMGGDKLLAEQSIPELAARNEAAAAVMAVRSLLAHHRVTMDPSKMKNWDVFSDRFQDMIIRA